MNRRLTIAIDGPAGSGKSTIARRIAKKMDYLYLNSGAMYRAVTLMVVSKGVPLTHVPTVVKLARDCRIDFSENGQVTLLNGADVSDKIRTPEVNRVVSEVSKIPELRHEIVKQQREIGVNGGIIAEGRDVTTVVFPNAELKFYLDASVEERARRHFAALNAKGINCTLELMEENIRLRDETDSARKHSPLRTAEDAIVIDTTTKTINQVVQIVMEQIRKLI